jgi:hypothetical protein
VSPRETRSKADGLDLGTMFGALGHGLPQVVLPQGADNSLRWHAALLNVSRGNLILGRRAICPPRIHHPRDLGKLGYLDFSTSHQIGRRLSTRHPGGGPYIPLAVQRCDEMAPLGTSQKHAVGDSAGRTDRPASGSWS